MKTRNSTDFAILVQKFLTDYLPNQRNYSKNTILSYRDTFKKLVRFLIDVKSENLRSFSMDKFTKELIIEFLGWYREEGSSTSTTNQRLAAIKSFSEFCMEESVEYMANLQQILNIKSKKKGKRDVEYLSVNQITQLINLPDPKSLKGLRHRAILTLLYDSGCRVQELCDLTIGDLNLSDSPTVRLFGKGQKVRTVVISNKTADLLKEYIKRCRESKLRSDLLIVNRYGQKIDRDGVNYIVKKYSKIARNEDVTFPANVHCHTLRHSKAMHLLAANVNIVYIRDFLGHEDISTTMIYAQADNRIKEKVIGELSPKLTEDVSVLDWREDQDLMTLLNSLK